MDISPAGKSRSPRNKTIEIAEGDTEELRLKIVDADAGIDIRPDQVICGDAFTVLKRLQPASVDLLFADPPYNLTKKFGSNTFSSRANEDYEEWLDSWLSLCTPALKPTASIYICGDWRSGSAIERAGSKYFTLRNRITWEREKGRGAKANWKNAAEDIWYFTMSDDFTFNLDAVKLRRRVIAPYRSNGEPKDWNEAEEGNYRDTHPSNIWTDITVPFWSMPENTDHPTQKPEKLLAKILLASTNPSDVVLDPFAGSGTTAVASRKLGRRFVAIEKEERFCLLAAKRLGLAESDGLIQGLSAGVFWERNTTPK